MEQATDKLRLLQMTFKKVSADPDFVAYALHHFLKTENRTSEQLQDYLDCSEENFYKLGLSKVPNPHLQDYPQRLAAICEFTGIDADKLHRLLSQNTGTKAIEIAIEYKTLEYDLFSAWEQSENKTLRHSLRIIKSLENSVYSTYKKIPASVYRRAAILIAVLFAFLISNTTVDEKSLYASAKTNDKTIGKQLALRDNTYVYKIPFKKV